MSSGDGKHKRRYENLENSPSTSYESFPAAQNSQGGLARPLTADLFAHPAPDAHQVIVHDSESQKGRWDHQKELDQFFCRIYEYHQKGGFQCMLLSEIFELLQFIFVLGLSVFLLQCVNYDVLFANKFPNTAQAVELDWTNQSSGQAVVELGKPVKRTLNEALVKNCAAKLNFWVILLLIVAAVFWVFRLVRVVFQLLQYWEIRTFYATVLKITSSDLDNLTWHEVLQLLCKVQQDLNIRLCINQPKITELDVYQRILRQKNYFVALTNKGLLPPKGRLPILGTPICFFPSGFKFNLEFLFFWGPWAPWKDYCTLKPEFKRRDALQGLSVQLERLVFWLAIGNLLLSPLILFWQILYSFFSYAEQIKRQPGALGMRRWSLFGRYYFRHFNELDHELNMRLNRAFRPASQFMDLFTPKLWEIISKNVALVAGSFFAILVILSVWDEDVLQVEHVLTFMTISGLIVLGCKVFIPDENLVWCPELLMSAVLAQVHYLPDAWKGQAHTGRIRTDFSQLFQFKVSYLAEELLSPLLTPFALMFWLRPRVSSFVDFFHRHTVEVPGLGDVCSFAQMDLDRHGDPKWQMTEQKAQRPTDEETRTVQGKTEMSLMHFNATNPEWAPPPSAVRFLANFRQLAAKDAAAIQQHHTAVAENPLLQSLTSLGFPSPLPYPQFSMLGLAPTPRVKGRGIRNAEGPLGASQEGTMASLHLSGLFQSSTMAESCVFQGGGVGGFLHPILESAANEMSINALYLNELHHRRLAVGRYGSMMTPLNSQPATPQHQLWAIQQEDQDQAPQMFQS